MEYNFKVIGQRIKELRNANKWSQDNLIERLHISRNTLSAVENGRQDKFTLDILLSCCDVFGCDMGYLLGEYEECKKLDAQFVYNETGLSEKAVANLKQLTTYDDGAKRLSLLNWLLNDPRFTHQFLDNIIKYCDRSLVFAKGRELSRNEQFIFSKLTHGDVTTAIQLKETGEFSATITQQELTTLESLRDVSYMRTQRALDNVLDCLKYHHLKKNGCDSNS